MAKRSQDTMITTGEAADMCCVTPDAVLKWIKGGKIPGVRTAGGHYRINPAWKGEHIDVGIDRVAERHIK